MMWWNYLLVVCGLDGLGWTIEYFFTYRKATIAVGDIQWIATKIDFWRHRSLSFFMLCRALVKYFLYSVADEKW